MIEELLKRPPIHDFLNKYPSERWKKLITDVFEIGVLNLYNSFNTYEFSEREFSSILNDLRYYNSHCAPTPYSYARPIKPYINEPRKHYYEQRIFKPRRKMKHPTPAKTEVFIGYSDQDLMKKKNYYYNDIDENGRKVKKQIPHELNRLKETLRKFKHCYPVDRLKQATLLENIDDDWKNRVREIKEGEGDKNWIMDLKNQHEYEKQQEQEELERANEEVYKQQQEDEKEENNDNNEEIEEDDDEGEEQYDEYQGGDNQGDGEYQDEGEQYQNEGEQY